MTSDAQEGGTSTLHPLEPWQVLQINFGESSGLVAVGLPTRPLLRENDRLHMAVGPWKEM